jgi:glycosyltransferase involved in cell wall biosynthesis
LRGVRLRVILVAAVKLSVIMPAYNERDTILETLRRVLAVNIEKQVIVVDDGSTDGTREIIDGFKHPDLLVVHHARNRGKGCAIRSALPHVKGDAVIIQDADGEYDPQDYPALLEPLVSGRADVVYGSRFLGTIRYMPLANRIFNLFISLLARVLFGTRLTDEGTCYKLFKASTITSLPLRCRGFEFCPEVTAKVLKRGLRLEEVPIRYEARTARQGRKIKWHDAFRITWALLKYRFAE